MMTNQEAKRAVILRLWTEEVLECQASGMTVRAWCRSKKMNLGTYHYHKTKVREAACQEVEHQERKTSVFADRKPVEVERTG